MCIAIAISQRSGERGFTISRSASRCVSISETAQDGKSVSRRRGDKRRLGGGSKPGAEEESDKEGPKDVLISCQGTWSCSYLASFGP